ncbi:MAG TPA: hypothetical protein VKH81_06490 [Candidatus Angelobacter sp.]|nr:hypothetical protein [Candidatus Angelobacter sp.]
MEFTFSKRLVVVLCVLACAWPGLALAQSPPTIVKAFSAPTVGLNESVTLTFTITNPNPATDLTGVAFNDNMPAGLLIANPDSLGGTCDTSLVTTFATGINMVGATILANSSCTISVDVLATGAGDQVNTTDPITSIEGGTGGTATATVTVVVPDVTIALSHTGNFLHPQTGATYTITVSNPSTADTSALITVNDSLPAGLTATALAGPNWNCTLSPLQCARGDTLFAGTSFEPITLTVDVANNAASSVTNTATVSGGGETNTANDSASDPTQIDPALALVAQTTSATVTAGKAATTVLNVTANGGGLGAITFACSGLPALASCSFNPSSVTVSGPVNLILTTAGSSSSSSWPGSGRFPPASYLVWFAFLSLAVLCFGRSRKLRWRLAGAIACVALLALAGCGSSKSARTPAGTFAVTVTASSATGGATATSTVNLTVQ